MSKNKNNNQSNKPEGKEKPADIVTAGTATSAFAGIETVIADDKKSEAENYSKIKNESSIDSQVKNIKDDNIKKAPKENVVESPSFATESSKPDVSVDPTVQNMSLLVDTLKYYAYTPHRGNYKAIEVLKRLGIYER